MTEEEIIKICEQYKIKNYTINDDMTIDVSGDVELSSMELANIPLKFGKVNGTFNCSSNMLKTLEGCPYYVGGSFYCNNNELRNLKHCPEYIGDEFYCSYNQIVTLKWFPKHIGTGCSCRSNNLTTLDLPMNFHIGGDFWCARNKITEAKEYGKLFFGHIGKNIYLNARVGVLEEFLNKNKNPPKKDLPRILSKLRKIQL